MTAENAMDVMWQFMLYVEQLKAERGNREFTFYGKPHPIASLDVFRQKVARYGWRNGYRQFRLWFTRERHKHG